MRVGWAFIVMGSVNQGLDYELIERTSDSCVLIKFAGGFNGQQIIWHAKIRTLGDYFENSVRRDLLSQQEVKIKQFIEVNKKAYGYKVDIILNLKIIDEASIMRAIIMIRKYKRLHIGRHEYGEAVSFSLK